MATGLTAVATQGAIKHFRYMIRLRFLTTGGSSTEQISLPNIDLKPSDYVRIIPDPNSQVLATDIIEQLSSRSQTQIIIASSDGSTNIPANLSCELIIIRRQLGDGNTTLVNAGNDEDTLFGPGVESGRVTNGNIGSGSITVPSQLITSDSEVWIDLKKTNTSILSGLVEAYASRTPGASFVAAVANSNDSPSGTVTFDWIVLPR